MAYAADSQPRIERLARDDIDAALARVTLVARLMDSIVAIPGTNVRLGFDALIGLVPVVGDLVSQAIASYIIWEAHQLGVSKVTLWRMIGNSLIDTVIGAIPFAGDAFDVAFRANMKNLRLLQQHLEKHGHTIAAARGAKGRVIEGDYRRVA